MTKKNILIWLVAMLPVMAFADKVRGTLTLTSPSIEAVCIYDTDAKTATLGNGYNACIAHYQAGELIIPGSVTYNAETYKVVVGQFAFRLCNQLTKVTVSEGVESIGEYAFVGCSTVTSVVLPSTVESIGAGAFCNLSSLKTFRCKSATPPTWQWNDVFSVLGTNESMRKMANERCLYIPGANTPGETTNAYTASKFDGTSTGTLTGANEKVGWEEAFARIYEVKQEAVQISTLAELEAFRNAVNDGTYLSTYGSETFELTTDITISETHLTTYNLNNGYDGNWTPIGTAEHPFEGIFNGGGHVIKNMAVKLTGTEYAGLFGYATNATIYNLCLDGPAVLSRDYVGSVLGFASTNTRVTDVLVLCRPETEGAAYYGNIHARVGSGGGIVGNAENATIERCYFDGVVSALGWGGGIIGNCGAVTVNDCEAAGSIFSVYADLNGTPNIRLGGIVGGTYRGNVTMNRCLARNTLNRRDPALNTSGYNGYLVGKTQDGTTATCTNCVYWAAGLIGDYSTDDNVTHTNCQSFDVDNVTGMLGTGTSGQLGTDKWTYFTGNYQEYPIPSTLVEMFTKQVNSTDANGLVYQPVGLRSEPTAYEVVGYTGNATSLEIPATYNSKPVTAILDNVFKDNQTLTTITLGSNLTTIGASAFEDCDALTAVDLPDAVTYVGQDAFRGCDNLESFNIGKGFKDHTGNFLAYCPKLTTLTASRGNDDGYLCVDNVLLHNVYNYRSYVIVCAPGKTGDYTIPVANLTYDDVCIFPYCFATCTGLTSITFPAGKYYSLWEGAFDGAINLRYVDLSGITGTIDDEKYNVKRSDANNPFYGMSKNTIIYLQSGHTATQGEPNVVINGVSEYIDLTDTWDFSPRVAITATQATTDRKLMAKDVTYVEVVRDEDNNIVYQDEAIPVLDEDGNQVYEEDGVTPKTQLLPKFNSEVRHDARGYTSYLPYDLTLTAGNAKVYKPSSSEVVEGVTMVTFTEVESKEMEAYKPYYIVVSGDEVVTLTKDDATISKLPNNPTTWTVGGYEFKGTTETISNESLYDADKPTYLLQSDGSC